MHTKRSIFILSGLLTLAALAAVPPLPNPPTPLGNVTLDWDHPPEAPEGNTNWFYRVYSSSDMVNWTVITNVPGTNTQVTLPMRRAQWFFYATTVDKSNVWIESVPSNVALTESPPPSGNNLRVSVGRL